MSDYFNPQPLSLFFDGENYDTEFIADLMNTCLKNAKTKYIPNIKKALEIKDKKLLKDNIHPLKSSLGQIGLDKCCKFGDKIDKEGINAEWNDLENQVNEFFKHYEDSMKALKTFNESHNIKGIDY